MTDDAPEALDPIAMARFLVMPGAGRLLTAFSEIPPGPLRDSVIHHAEVIAQTYAAAPPKHRQPDPLRELARSANVALPPPVAQTVTGRPPPPINEPSPYGGDDRDSQIVQLALSGMKAGAIAAELKIAPHIVYGVTAKARAAGVPLAKKGEGPAPTKAAAHQRETPKVWHTTTDTLHPQGLRLVEGAANKRGISAQEYLDRRQTAVAMAQQGQGYSNILAATGEGDAKVVSAWLATARAAGIEIPYIGAAAPTETPAAAPEAAQEAANVVPMTQDTRKAVDPSRTLIFGVLADYGESQVRMMQKTADARGLTLQAYIALREDIARKRLAGWTIPQIAADVRQDKQFIRDICRAAGARGVVFPTQKEDAA